MSFDQLEVEVDGQMIKVQAAVADYLPVPMLLGTDVPQMQSFLQKGMAVEPNKQESMEALVGTGARTKDQREEEDTGVDSAEEDSEKKEKHRASGSSREEILVKHPLKTDG